MNAEEKEVCEFLKSFGENYVSVNEISKRFGHRHRSDQDRTWARPILRRMEMDGILESNPFGEYRLRHRESDTTSFKKALAQPGFALGDTAIIFFDDKDES